MGVQAAQHRSQRGERKRRHVLVILELAERFLDLALAAIGEQDLLIGPLAAIGDEDALTVEFGL